MSNHSYLIIDSGSTKMDFICHQNSEKHTFETIGFNPIIQPDQILRDNLQSFIDVHGRLDIHQIFYYGTGVLGGPQQVRINHILREAIPSAMRIEVVDDLLGAARGLCQRQDGLVCILGTGSNAAVYENQVITRKSTTLGYPLGDEGSGNHLGRIILREYLYRRMPSHLQASFSDTFPDLNKSSLLEIIHQHASPSAYLAQFSMFMYQNRHEVYMKSLILGSFRSFINYHILPLYRECKHPVSAVGSIAFYYHEILEKALSTFQIPVGTILQKPMPGLLEYHKN